jgi:hypothetical protein
MDILFWIFITILLIIGYNCFLKQKISTEKSVEPFYDNFMPYDQQRIHHEQVQNSKNLTQKLTPNYINNPNPNSYHQTQSMSNQGAVNAGLIDTSSDFNGVSDKSSLNFANFNDIPVAENSSGVLKEQTHQSVSFATNPNSSTRLQSKDLIPQGDENNTWKKLNPDPEGWLEGRNFLQAGYHLGINTIGQSRKNANYQLRSEPPNPRDQVSVWNQSQIDPDVRRCFELN